MGESIRLVTVENIRAQLNVAESEEPSTMVELNLHNHGLDCIGPNLEACAKLRVLDLSFNRLCAIDGVRALTDLRELRLYCNRISRLSGLSSCTRLQVLELHGNQLGDQPLGPAAGKDDGLAKLSALHTLNLDRNPLSDCGLVALQLGAIEQLAMLSLSHTRITSLAPLARLTRLEHLEANGNAISSLEGSIALGWATSLTELQLSANQIADLRPLRVLKRLVVLHLNDNRLRSLRGFPAMPALVELQLGHNLLGSIQPLASAPPATAAEAAGAQQATARAGAASEKMAARPGVRPGSRPTSRTDPRAGKGTASAKQTDATVAGADDGAQPAPSCLCPSLEVLDLAGNTLTDSLALVEALATFPELAELRLHGNPLCADGAALARALGGSGAPARLSLLDDVPLADVLQRLADSSAQPADGVLSAAPASRQVAASAPSRPSAPGATPAPALHAANHGEQVDATHSGPGHEAIPLVRPPSSRAPRAEQRVPAASEVGVRSSIAAMAAQEAALEQMRLRMRARLDKAMATVGTPRQVSRSALDIASDGAPRGAPGTPPPPPPASSASAPGSRVGSARPAPGGVRVARPSADAIAPAPARADAAQSRADAQPTVAARGAPAPARPAAASTPVRGPATVEPTSISGVGAAGSKPALARVSSKSRLDAARTFSRKCSSSAAQAAPPSPAGAAAGACGASAAPLAAAILSGTARSLAARDPHQAAQVLILDEVVAGAAERPARFVLLPADAQAGEGSPVRRAGAGSADDAAAPAEQSAREVEPASVMDVMGAEAVRAQVALARADRPPSRQLAPAASGAYASFRVPVRCEGAPQPAAPLGLQLLRPGSASAVHVSLRTPLRESPAQAQMSKGGESASAAPVLVMGAARSRRAREAGKQAV